MATKTVISNVSNLLSRLDNLQSESSEEEAEDEGIDDWWLEDLVWPDPLHQFPACSGITPMELGWPKAAVKRGDQQDTRCDRAMRRSKPPRPEDLPWNIAVVRSDPPSVDIDDVEEFLVHDPLFVEFFNAFLTLPSFPEPIMFNVATGGFEVVSDGKQKLARQIKEAVRSQNLTARMYRVARRHAFSDIPIIPIEDVEAGPEEVKIDTSYQVTTLNKDQGIYWIRAERLPIFLESDFYFTYRLAKVISQARLFNDGGEYIVMKLDFTPRPKKVKKAVEETPPNPEEIIIKKMFISFGDVRGAAKEAYFSQAMDELKTQPTFTSLGPKVSTRQDGGAGEAAVEEPSLKVEPRPRSSVFHSQYFGDYNPGLAGPDDEEPPIQDKQDKHPSEQMFSSPSQQRPFTPRPADKIHSSSTKLRRNVSQQRGADEEMVAPGELVRVYPKQEHYSGDDESGIGDMDDREEVLDKKMISGPIIDEIYNDGTWETDGPNIILKSRGDLASVIVGAVMKKTMADLLSVDEQIIVKDPAISGLYPSPSLTCLSVDKLELCAVEKKKRRSKVDGESSKTTVLYNSAASSVASKNTNESKKGESTDETTTDDEAVGVKGRSKQPSVADKSKSNSKLPASKSELEKVNEGKDSSSVKPKAKEPVHIKWDKPLHKPAEEESDADSLLDSDEDFEERDTHFRRNKDKWHSLTSLKGIMDFKKFLEGTSGEKYWELWIDIDKGHLIADETEKQQFIMHMRNRYYQHGSYYELSTEDKKKLGLENLSSWVPEYLFQIHPHVLEPLILYWAPRYLLKHLVRPHPERYPMYSQIKSVVPSVDADPHPHTRALLPLGPKSCCPRSSSGPGIEEQISTVYKYNEAEFSTTPKVGNRRVYGADTMKRLALTPTAKYLGIRPKTSAASLESPEGSESRVTQSTGRLRRGSQDSMGSQRGRGGPSPSLSHVSPSAAPVGKRTTTASADSFVGKLPGVPSKSQPPQQAPSRACSAVADSASGRTRPKSSVSTAKMGRKPCPNRPLTAVLGEGAADRLPPKPQLPPAKKPKDLLSPMLKIIDTKSPRRRRVQTAPPDRYREREETKTTFYRQDSQESGKSCDQQRPMSGLPGDAVGPDSIEFTEIQDCDFLGSQRMEFLLQALSHEQASGKTFRKYIEKSERDDWINNLDFWEQVQEYRKLFYKEKLDLFLITKMAKSIFATCIVEGGAQSIGVSDSIELQVMEHLSPAYEDLFDNAEEFSLKVLFEAFRLYLSQDVKTYCKVERSDVTRRLETKNTYILNLQKQGIIKEGPLTPDDPMDGYVEPVCDESLLEKIPEQYRDWTLDKLLHNRLELESFRQYLAENYAEMDLKCWMDMEAWRRTPPEDERKRDQRCRDIKKNYLNRKYFFGPSSPAGKEGQNKVMEVGGGWGKFLEDKPHADSILLAQKYVRERLEKKHLPLFLLSKEFQARQSPRLSMADSAEDVMVQKKRRSQAVLKVILQKEDDFYNDVLEETVTNPEYRKRNDIYRKNVSVFPHMWQVENMSTRLSIKPSRLSIKYNKLPLSTPKLPPITPISQRSSERDLPPKKYKNKQQFLLESKWVSSTKEIFLFKHALQNPITCKLFRKYVALKGDNMENNVLFWLEIQNYKKMNHGHTDDANLNQKISAIIHCFLDSTIPPALQIDIPQEMAERILDHKHEKSPYLFREAQLATFRILLTHWQPFCEWRNNMTSDEKALSTLERHRIISKQKEAARREEIEQQRERERLLRAELGLGENDDLPEDLFDDEDPEGGSGKMEFSYAQYIESMRNGLQGLMDNDDVVNLHLTSFDDNASQTVRGIPDYSGQPYEERPGYEPEDAEDLEPRMMNYNMEDCRVYFDYLMKEEKERQMKEEKERQMMNEKQE